MQVSPQSQHTQNRKESQKKSRIKKKVADKKKKSRIKKEVGDEKKKSPIKKEVDVPSRPPYISKQDLQFYQRLGEFFYENSIEQFQTAG